MSVPCCLPTNPAMASTTSPSANSRRRCSNATSRRPRRSAGSRSAGSGARLAATHSGWRLTSRRKSTSRACHSAPAAAPSSPTRSRRTASTTSRSACGATVTRRSRGWPRRTRSRSCWIGRACSRSRCNRNVRQATGQPAPRSRCPPHRTARRPRWPARARRHLPEEAVRPAGDGAPTVPGTLQLVPASAPAAGHLFRLDRRAARGRRSGRHTEPASHLRHAARRRPRGRTASAARQHPVDVMRRAYRRPVTAGRPRGPVGPLPPGPGAVVISTRASRWRWPACW